MISLRYRIKFVKRNFSNEILSYIIYESISFEKFNLNRKIFELKEHSKSRAYFIRSFTKQFDRFVTIRHLKITQSG